eukprot:COSAG01_NODE_24365_length_781_cov_3.722874_1_plen_236_part_01
MCAGAPAPLPGSRYRVGGFKWAGVAAQLTWCSNLLRWNAVGRGLFPNSRIINVKIEGDASPSGWGAQGARISIDNDNGDLSERYEQWSASEAELDQTERELLGLDRAIHAWGADGVDFTDRVLRATMQSQDALDWLHIAPGQAFQKLYQSISMQYTDKHCRFLAADPARRLVPSQAPDPAVQAARSIQEAAAPLASKNRSQFTSLAACKRPPAAVSPLAPPPRDGLPRGPSSRPGA